MKILRLGFKNLNSLAGVWEVDFKHPDYVSSGIFAITGPTGAGKTTILDAICLALYGQTPRLGRITQGDNEIMSRQTGECFAEVEFETAKGRFRCHWSQHRSRKQADGQLQSPRHEIAEADTCVILESKLRGVADKVEEVTGMDFDRFTRSMLLAQGGFAAFLQARPDERAPILEQITGTAIYSHISIKVHERTTEERRRLTELRAELGGIVLLTTAEAEALFREKSDLQQREHDLVATAQIFREAQSWLERIAMLEAELLQLNQDRFAFEARKSAAAPELERLALADRALKRGGDHARIVLIRAQQETERSELGAAAELLPQLQLSWQGAFDALECTESGLSRVLREQVEGAELIRAVRALDVRIGEAQAQLRGLADEIERAGRRNGEYRLTITQCEQRMNSTYIQSLEMTAFLEKHRTDAGLAESLTGIEQQLKVLQALDKQCRDISDALARQNTIIENAILTRSNAESICQTSQQAVVVAEGRLAGMHAALETMLQGRDISLWRDETEALSVRQNRLGTVQEAVSRIEVTRQKMAELLQRVEPLRQKRQTLQQQEVALAGEHDLREQIVRRLQDNVILLNRVRSLEEDRTQLVDGVPCPLCGAAEHPYAAGNIPPLDEAQQELKLAITEALRVRESLSAIKMELVSVVKDLQQIDVDQADMQQRLECDESLCSNAFTEMDIIADATSWLEVIGRESDVCRMALSNIRGIILDAEQHEQAERRAQTELARLKDELAERDKARLAARFGEESAFMERTRLEAESAALQADLDRLLAEVERVLVVYGYSEISPDRCDELLASLTVRRNVYVERLQNGERLEKERADATAELDKQQALLAESERALVDKEQQVRERSSERDGLVEQRLEQYGERNPDVEEKRLADALRHAGELRDAALREQHRLHADLGGLKAQIERLTLSIAQRGEQLARLESTFSLRLIEDGFTDETDFLQACLPQKQLDELMRLAETLRNDGTALQARHHDRTTVLAGEMEKKLTDKPLELIREECAAVSGKLSELQKGLGVLEQRLQQHADQQQRHQSRLQAIEIQNGECDRWERLHSLIGSGDGKKFRNFAQGLTFELMVAHANRQLQKMSDRYILIRDTSQPLELNVIDNYQAGEVRSTKNLSGGESFIASLALSLGLSSMASRNVRVDSLFLDEGFGTLDEDALETALETLSGLQQDGKLIGIISHVPALKERIGTQIQVEAGSAGRSSLSGPGCRRLSHSGNSQK